MYIIIFMSSEDPLTGIKTRMLRSVFLYFIPVVVVGGGNINSRNSSDGCDGSVCRVVESGRVLSFSTDCTC